MRLLIDALVAAVLARVFVVLQRRAYPCPPVVTKPPPDHIVMSKPDYDALVGLWYSHYDGEQLGV